MGRHPLRENSQLAQSHSRIQFPPRPWSFEELRRMSAASSPRGPAGAAWSLRLPGLMQGKMRVPLRGRSVFHPTANSAVRHRAASAAARLPPSTTTTRAASAASSQNRVVNPSYATEPQIRVPMNRRVSLKLSLRQDTATERCVKFTHRRNQHRDHSKAIRRNDEQADPQRLAQQKTGDRIERAKWQNSRRQGECR